MVCLTSCSDLISYLSKRSFVLNKQKKDKGRRILIFDVTLDADQYILDLYDANTESERKGFKRASDLVRKKLDIN